jgi:hypothetical protein
MLEEFPRTLMDLERRFSSDDACRRYLWGVRWLGGFVCPKCAGRTAWQATRGRWVCGDCRHQATVTAGTIFQDSHLPLTTWFRAMWHVTSQDDGVSALELQQVLGLSSYKTAWAMLHKLRRAMTPHRVRDQLRGVVEVQHTYWGREEGVAGRLTDEKALIMVAAEVDGKGIGRIRLRHVSDLTRTTLHGFIAESIDLGSEVRTDSLKAYRRMKGYVHDRELQCRQSEGDLLPRVDHVVWLLRRWLLGTHQGAIGRRYLDHYLNEFAFRFNRREFQHRGELFDRLIRQAVQVEPVPFDSLLKPQALGGG